MDTLGRFIHIKITFYGNSSAFHPMNKTQKPRFREALVSYEGGDSE